jgi:hypothetical protein
VPITVSDPFKGRQYPGEVILQAVRWYLRYPLAYEHVAELLAERGLAVDASELSLAFGNHGSDSTAGIGIGPAERFGRRAIGANILA